MIASVNLDVSIVNVTNESMASWRKKGREREGKRGRKGRQKALSTSGKSESRERRYQSLCKRKIREKKTKRSK